MAAWLIRSMSSPTPTAFVEDWLQIVGSRTWRPGSSAEAECAADTLTDDGWGDYPCRDAWITAHTTANAGLDHLRALAVLLPADGVVLALSTTARGALEAFAVAHYLTAPDIPHGRERVRRYMNTRLASLHAPTMNCAPPASTSRSGFDASETPPPERDSAHGAPNRECPIWTIHCRRPPGSAKPSCRTRHDSGRSTTPSCLLWPMPARTASRRTHRWSPPTKTEQQGTALRPLASARVRPR